MAFVDDLTQFLENRIAAFDATIDLSPGSPAQVQIIGPTVARFSEDPLDVDIRTFLLDRMTQAFPDMAADQGGDLEDLLIKPLQLMLEPFKRQVESVKLGQSVKNAALMSDDEADALGANWFEPRDEGKFTGGAVRLYFNAPTTTRVTTDKRIYTNDGRNYFPVENFFLTSTQMLFQRQGNFYYIDVIVRAEAAGNSYNVAAGDIANIDDVAGVVKVANLSPFSDGAPRQDNATYLGAFDTVLTERSLVTKRGATASVNKLFDSVQAMQVLGAGEPGMNRDILTGTSEGLLFISGRCTLYGDWLYLPAPTYKDTLTDPTAALQAGDIVRLFHSGTKKDLKILEVFKVNVGADTTVLVLESAPFGLGILTLVPIAIYKPGFITISGIPGGMLTTSRVPDGEVHLGGHTDVFVRPTSDSDLSSTLSNIVDEKAFLASLTGHISGLNGGSHPSSSFVDPNSNFVGVNPGDALVIENGQFAGTYKILDVIPGSPTVLHLDTLFSTSVTNLRYRIIKKITIDLVTPKSPRLPFDTNSVNDLSTVVGSNLFRLNTNDSVSFGAKVGDTVEILDGPDAGTFTILSFDGTLGGFGLLVDRPATASDANLRYTIYRSQPGITLPLVRVKSLAVLDTTNQVTGITVPYGDAVDVRAQTEFTGAGEEIKVFDNQVVVVPSTTDWNMSNDPATPGAGVDARFSQLLETHDGPIRKLVAYGGAQPNPITTYEVNIPPFFYNSKNDALLFFANERDNAYYVQDPGSPPTDTPLHRTSPVAQAKIGDALTILDGPNKGSYLIKDLRVFEMWNKSQHGHSNVTAVQVEPPLPSNALQTAMNFVDAYQVGLSNPAVFSGQPTTLLKFLQYATDWKNASGFWNTVITQLATALTGSGFTASSGDCDLLLTQTGMAGYAVGPAARGIVRAYFQEPVSTELFFGDVATQFQVSLDASKLFRLSPDTEAAQILPASSTRTDPSTWARTGVFEFYDPSGSPTAPTTSFAAMTGSPLARRGVRTGDQIELYPAINDLSARGNMSSSWLCVTTAGSNIVQLIVPRPTTGGDPATLAGLNNSTPLAGGQLLFIDSGPDTGAYTVTAVLQDEVAAGSPPNAPGMKVILDRALSHSTLAYPATPPSFSYGRQRAGTNKIYDKTIAGTLFGSVAANQYIICYRAMPTSIGIVPNILKVGEDAALLGVFKVTATVVTEGADGSSYAGKPYITVDRTVTFPDDIDVNWLIVAAPTTAPAATIGGGTDLTDQYVRFRLYDSVPQTRGVSIPWTATYDPTDPTTPASVATRQIDTLNSVATPTSLISVVTGQQNFAHKAPFRITRPGVFRISSTDMAKNQDQGLFYVDLEVVSYSPSVEQNITEDASLILTGVSNIQGYVFDVADENFTFSEREEVSIIMPNSILPVGSTPDLDNELRLAGQNVLLGYTNAPVVAELQTFFDSPLDRVLIANVLVRHFLPSYLYIQAAYSGGSAETVVAADIITLVKNMSADRNVLQVKQIADIMTKRGASQVTMPMVLVALTHGNDRRIRGMRSSNAIGGDTAVFKGVTQQSYLIPGPDTSGTNPRPTGEQIFLTRS